MNTIENSPLAIWQQHCCEHKLAYQKDDAGNAIFYPRLVSPKTGESNLSWHISAGLGTVYSVTTMYAKGNPTGNIALVDLDEGFRMLSSVRLAKDETVAIGMRVKVQFEATEDSEMLPMPVFVLAGDRA